MVCEGDWDLVVDHSAEKQGRRREDNATSCWLKSCCVDQVTGKKVKGDLYVEKERVKRSVGGCGGLRALSLLHCCQAEAAALQASLPSSLKMHAGVGLGVLDALRPS